VTPLQVAASAMFLLMVALWCFERANHRAPASVAIARRRMSGEDQRGRGAELEVVLRRPLALVESTFGTGLGTIGMTPTDVVSRVVNVVVSVFLIVLAGAVVLSQFGSLPWSLAWVVVSAATATTAGWTVWRGVGARVRQRRDAVRRAATDFVQLVAVGLTTDHSVEEAIRFALDVGEGDAFDVIRSELLSAPQRGLAIWDALREVADLYSVRELEEFATSVERQGLQGVSIGATVASMAVAMRERALDGLERAADKANANLAGPTIGFVVATIAFLAYPLAQRISEAFGG
jgi:Flp pilus assembly protein TadB